MESLPSPLDPIAARIARGLATRPFTGCLKLDCGAEGVIVIRDGAVTREDGPADCTVGLTAETLSRLIAGTLNPVTGVVTGKLKIGGDAAVAMRLGQLLR